MINEQTRETDFHIRQFERNSHHDDSSGHYRRGRIFLFDSEYDLDQQYIRTEQQIERTMERYRAQFVQLDLMVAQMNQTSQYLTEQFDMMNAQMGRK